VTGPYEHPGPWPGHGPGWAPDGYAWAGRDGRAKHYGPPLAAEQVAELYDGAEIVVTWFGGNGPWPYRVLVDSAGVRRIQTFGAEELPGFRSRITLGWGPEAQAWVDQSWHEPPERVRQMWAALRSGPDGSTV
jgi:hypothetical protein